MYGGQRLKLKDTSREGAAAALRQPLTFREYIHREI
jgi:hypothetical protein